MNIDATLAALGLDPAALEDGELEARSPIDGEIMARVTAHNGAAIDAGIALAHEAFLSWRLVPAPRRGELVRLLGEELRAHKEALGRLVTIESGKILEEGLGEVQEMIDICDFAVGLSRQLYGRAIASERPRHKMVETWHPLGPVGIISAFNFPVAVWSWNTAIALVCGDSVIWKPSEKTPLSALAAMALLDRALARYGDAPEGLAQVVIGGRDAGRALVDDARISLISATGSTRMGRDAGPRVARRFGRTLLELGGNNAILVAPTADLDLAQRAILFGAVGTAGQRCTTTRRLFVHTTIYDDLLARLKSAYAGISVGDPLDKGTLVGPLIDVRAFKQMTAALARTRDDGGEVCGGGRLEMPGCPGGYYVLPALVEMPAQTEIVREETFAPILYVFRYDDLGDAIALHNAVPQGLSSAIFTNDLREAERFLSVAGSDCGIANVNIGTSGAEIGGAFGGEKETGGGRESGSDAWKAYMRRSTSTVNYGAGLPLSQGISFGGD